MADQLLDNSDMITGECKNDANECIEGYWCLDDGCPPGCQPIPEFPETPPFGGECAISPITNSFVMTGGYIPCNDGTDDIIIWGEDSTNSYIERWDKDFTIRGWRTIGNDLFPLTTTTDYWEFPGKPLLLADGSLLATFGADYSTGVAIDGRLMFARINIVDGTLLTWVTSDSALYGSFVVDTKVEGGAFEDVPGIVRKAIAHKYIGSTRYNGMFSWNYITGEQDFISFGPYISNTPSVCMDSNDTHWIWSSPERTITAGSSKGGQVVSIHKQTLDITVLLTGEVDNPVVGQYDYVGYKLYTDDKYLLVFSGDEESQAFGYHNFGNSAIYVFDITTLVFIKRVRNPYALSERVDNYDNPASSFGMGFTKYGNFYYVGMTTELHDKVNWADSTGMLFVYDLDFNFVTEIKRPPLPLEGDREYHAIGVTKDRIYHQLDPLNTGNSKNIKVCTY